MKYLITRADDFGSALAANRAILRALEQGEYLKNVSCMAASPHIGDGAEALERLRKKRDFCVGLHAVLNSEWEKVSYHSILPPEKIPTLVQQNGVFYMHPMLFEKRMPDVEECMAEIAAQLDCLVHLGLTVEYVDTHMLPDAVIPGLKEALSAFAKQHGLIEQRWYYTFPAQHQPVLNQPDQLEKDCEKYSAWFDCMEEGKQYIHILHPACYSEETKLFYNQVLKGDSVALSREAEQRLLNSKMLEQMCEEKQIRCLKYTDAEPQGDTTMEAARNF